MDNLKVLPTLAAKVQKDVVEVLREILAKAESGKIKGVAAAVIYADGHTGSYSSSTEKLSGLIGGVGILHAELTQAAIAGTHEIASDD
jgi:hypothetical protein